MRSAKPDWGPPFDHLALRVTTPEPWLVDVGFGAFSHHPLRLDVRDEQLDPVGSFRVLDREEGDLDVLWDGKLQYRIERRPRELRDFEATCWWHQTSPRSSFTHAPVCSLLTQRGRITLSDRTLIRTEDGARSEQQLSGDDEVLAAYRMHFGIGLDRAPAPRRPSG